jgi:peptidoglycan hydrolase CwlO-like protein
VSELNATPVRGRLLRCVLVALIAVVGAVAVPAAHSVTLQSERQKARALAAEVAELDARIDAAVARYSKATRALETVRASIADNRRAAREARRQVDLARELLAEHARTIYKQSTPTTVDVLFGVASFGDLVSQLELLQRLGAGEADYVRTLREGERELEERSLSLSADEETAERLVAERGADLERLRSLFDDRRELLASAEENIRELAAEAKPATPRPSVTETADVDTGAGDGDGEWWPIIKRAAAANGVSADGMYRLMMAESGGSATIVGAGGYHGLYQYSLTTWRGSWNPYRSASIYNGEAQIKASALAISRGWGPSFWPTTFDWAFRD